MALPWPRRLWGFGLALVAMPVLTVALVAVPDHLDLASILLLYLLTVVLITTVGGIWSGGGSALAASALSNWYFTPPYHTWAVEQTSDVVALGVFLAVAGVVSVLVEAIARRHAEALRAQAESASLARLAGTVLHSDDPLQQLVQDLRITFGLEGVAILRRDADAWVVQTSAGPAVAAQPQDGTDSIALSDDAMLVLRGPRAPADDRRLLTAFAAQLAIALANRQLREKASRALALAEADRLRSGLLAAVSHDLRTPLSSIKASATSLLQDDVRWSRRETTEFLEAIVDDADRLNGLVGNLLDMSRVRAGAVQVHERAVGLDEVLPAALSGLKAPTGALDIDVCESLPPVRADPALLERVVANLVDNALTWSPWNSTVRIEAGATADHVVLRVMDHGPGIAMEDRARVFQPFQRLRDHSNGSGVGLGLAVAKGFAEAMGGELTVADTPGGGTTMVLTLEAMRDACPRR